MDGIRICAYLWAAFCVVWLIWAIRTKPVQQRESISSRLSYTVFVVLGFYLMFSADAPRSWLRLHLFPANPAAEVLGVVITAAGIGFAVWARLYLGGNWSSSVTVKAGHELVRTGPYRWVRHPIYTGLLVMCLGSAIEIGRLHCFLSLVVVGLGFWIKLKQEESLMLRHFPVEYPVYQKQVKALVPFVI